MVIGCCVCLRLDGSNWTSIAKLTENVDDDLDYHFGRAVSLGVEGTRVAIGARGGVTEFSAYKGGHVYVFEEQGFHAILVDSLCSQSTMTTTTTTYDYYLPTLHTNTTHEHYIRT